MGAARNIDGHRARGNDESAVRADERLEFSLAAKIHFQADGADAAAPHRFVAGRTDETEAAGRAARNPGELMHELNGNDVQNIFERSKGLVVQRSAIAKTRGVDLLVRRDTKNVHGIERNRAPDSEFIARRIRRGLGTSGSAEG